MNNKEKILSILDGSPNRLREKYFIKNNSELYNEIISYTKLDIPFKQKVWHFINEIPQEVLCYCGNKVSFKMNFMDGYKEYCSNKCSANSIDVKRKLKETLNEKYGVEHFSKTEEYKSKVKETSLQRYGVENYSKTKEYISKSKNTYNKKYGVDSYVKTKDYLEKSRSTCIEKYGVDSYVKTDEFKEKSKSSNLKRYGSKMLFQSEEYRNENFEISKNEFYISYSGNSISLFKCDQGKDHTFEISTDNYYGRKYSDNPICTVCNPISERKSIKELEFYKLISENYSNEIICNYKDKFELDIYLPDLNLGFEFNGIWWHSERYKEANYHINKTKHFEKKGIRVIHIWEDDWIHRKEIIKSQVLYLIKKTPIKILARKCLVKEISLNESKQFLKENHLQGNVSSLIKLGLFYNDRLVSVMTFDKFEGRKKLKENEWNLSRFSVVRYTSVVGGASKLLNFFIKNYQPKRIISYADLCWSSGNLYFSIGFKMVHITKPDYKYIINGKRIHKSNFKKSITKTTLTESNYAKEKKIYRIFDCGKIKFEMLF